MADKLSCQCFERDLAKARACEEAHRWDLQSDGDLTVIVTLNSVLSPKERYQARLCWKVYPDEPPSLKFRDPMTGRLDISTAWPVVRGFRPQSLDACVNWCSEGFALHPEWRTDPRLKWVSRGNVLLKVLRILQEELDLYCSGRFQQ